MVEDSGTFEVLEQRERARLLSVVAAVVGAIVAVILIMVDDKDPFFSGKGSDMGPILIISGVFIVVVGFCLAIPGMVSGRD